MMRGVLLQSPRLDVCAQMALDAALAQMEPADFVLRFYRWDGIAATFGYAQRFAEVERSMPAELLRACTRRPTGGGIVLHVEDLTFSCVFPAGATLRPGDHYGRLHAAVRQSLLDLGVEATLCLGSGDSAPSRDGRATQCFAAPVSMDLLSGGGKILGGAIRRRGDTVLYQGSLLRPDSRTRADEYEAAIAEGIAAEWGLEWGIRVPDAGLLSAAAELDEKFRSQEWIRRR